MAFNISDEDDPHHDEFDEYTDAKQPARPKFYRRRKFWICCIPTTIIAVVVIVVLALYVIMPKIAQGLMNKATISFSQIDIANPSPTSMDIVLQGDMHNTGPFHAEISFPGAVAVSWNNLQLGTTEIPGSSSASGGHGALNMQSSFVITNATAFSEFSSYMLNAQSFVWHFEGKINVKALGRSVKDLVLKKDITVNAFNGLSGVTIQKFSLPGDDPNGNGIIIEIESSVTNPSAIQMYMGDLTLAISYKNTLMGYVTASNLTMVRGPQILSMKGVLIPQNATEGLADTSEMMSRYIGNVVTDTIATGYEVKPDGVNPLDWLSSAIKSLKLTIPLQSPQPLQLIKALDLGALGLVFTPPTAYQPATTSTGVLANYSLPDGFGFKIQFTQVANELTLSRNNVTIANLNSSYSPSTSDANAGTLNFNLLATPLNVPEESHQVFQEFNRDLTIGSNLPFNVVGKASVFANTSIGTINLVNIPFNASTQLGGLQGLANPAPTITSLQVVSSTANDLTMAITVVIVNPSSISLNAGDVVLDLVYKGVRLGTVAMPNLAIVPGANTVNASSTIDPAASPEGLELLSLYTSGTGAPVNIVGTSASTAIDSLILAFSTLDIGSEVPGLQSKLLAGASLVVLDTTLTNGIAQTTVMVNNPFIPPMAILSIDCKITYNGVSLGTLVSTFSNPPVIPGVGQGTITAGLAMNTDPTDLVTLIRAQAQKNGMDTDVFDGLLSLNQGGNPPSSLFDGFNIADFTIKAMTGLAVDIAMTTTVKLGDYQVTIPYTQTGVAIATDQSILRLIPIVGTPIAQILVERAVLAFNSIDILAPEETGFQTDIVGAITDTGPLDAQIQFVSAVTISYAGKVIGSMMMPTVNATANKGAELNLAGVAFTVIDLAAFTDFNIFALNNAKFDWTISAENIVVNALGVALPGVTMTKTVTLDGFDKLASLQLSSYIINSIDATGMHMVISASISNPSTIGMTIPTSIFNTIFQGKVLGPAVAKGLALIPHGTSSFALNATIATGLGDMRPYLTGIFHNALNNVSTELDAQGAGAPGISWLDAAVKTLNLHTALPPLSLPPIESVTIDAMSMDFACDTCVWTPNVVSAITAKTNLPFSNGAPIIQLSQHIQILDKNGQLVGTLNTPYAPANASSSMVSTTTPLAPLVIADGSHEIYEAFIGDLNAATTYELGLSGTTDAILDLGELGQIEIQGINLDVKTPLDGLQGLKVIEFLNPLGMGSGEHNGIPTIDMTVLVNIHNPSKLTLNIGNLVLNGGVNYTEEGYLGTTSINNLQLVPGDNRYVSLASLSVLSPNMEDFLMSVLMSGNVSTLYLQGFSDSSSNPALSAGLKDLRSEIGIPPNFKVPNAGYPYLNNTVKIKVLPTTVDDGLVEMSMDFRSMYYGATVHFDDAVVDRDRFEAPFSNVALAATTGAPVPVFAFMSNFQFSVGGNDIKTVTFKVNFTDAIEPSNPLSRDKLVGMVERSKSGYVNSSIDLYPTIHFNNDPTQMNVDWTSGTYFPETGGIIPIQTGPDFALLLNWWDKNHPEAAAILDPVSSVTTTVAATSPATVSPLPVATTTASNPTQTTAAPSFTPSPSTAPITP